MIDKISTIKIHQSTKNDLEKLKLTPGESYENIIKRLIKKFEDENMRTIIIEGTKDTVKFDGEYNLDIWKNGSYFTLQPWIHKSLIKIGNNYVIVTGNDTEGRPINAEYINEHDACAWIQLQNINLFDEFPELQEYASTHEINEAKVLP